MTRFIKLGVLAVIVVSIVLFGMDSVKQLAEVAQSATTK